MKVLVVGSGGREHALVWKLRQSKKVNKVFAAPGNAGIGLIAQTINIKADDINGLANFIKKNHIDLTVIGPENPLADGIVDEFQKRKIRVFGPTKAAAELESSKVFAKEFMRKYHIPTAPFQVFSEPSEAVSFVKSAAMPIVIKADGLAAGKGVIIAKDLEEAITAIEDILTHKKFGDAGNKIIIETCLEGQEVSVMALSDGKNILMMLPSQDHKQIGEGDTGPNTGGMGAYCPAGFVDSEMMEFIREHVMEPAIDGMEKEGRRYRGVLYAGLIITEAGTKVLEFNCRFGDPETQAVLPLLKTDLFSVCKAISEGNLNSIDELEWNNGAAACVVLASKGYPGKAETGKRIYGLRNYSDMKCQLFHSGTKKEGKNWISAGGRVVGVTGINHDIKSALSRAYNVIGNIKFDGMTYRTDIGFKADMRIKVMGL
jgi:phosphoribosylamine--glycine ligase